MGLAITTLYEYAIQMLQDDGLATTVTHLECRFQRDGDSPARMMHAHVGLVNPRTCYI